MMNIADGNGIRGKGRPRNMTMNMISNMTPTTTFNWQPNAASFQKMGHALGKLALAKQEAKFDQQAKDFAQILLTSLQTSVGSQVYNKAWPGNFDHNSLAAIFKSLYN